MSRATPVPTHVRRARAALRAWRRAIYNPTVRGTCAVPPANRDGRFSFATVKMVGYPIPTGGVVGRLLRAQSRHPYRPAHLHALIVKQGFKVLISQVYDPTDPHIDSDPQFGVTKALLGDYRRHEEPHPSGARISPPWYSLDYTYVMEAGETKLPAPPIK